MGWGCGAIFWGVVILLFGVSIILRAVFNISIPLVRIFIAVVLIYVGIKILTGSFCCGNRNWSWHGMQHSYSGEMKFEGADLQDEYSIIFGSGDIDLTKINTNKEKLNTKIAVVFGSAVIKLDPDMPVKITVDTAFANAKMPGGNSAAFGKYVYKSPSFKEGEKYVSIKMDSVFSSVEVINQTPDKL